MTDERVLFRVRKTVFEMLRDRGYRITDAQIDETYEEFEKTYLEKPQINFLAYRPTDENAGDNDNENMDDGKEEAIYVHFVNKDEKLSTESIKKLMTWMNTYSTDNKSTKMSDLLNCIIIVKSGATSLAKKVSEFLFQNCLGAWKVESLCL